jgi:hypothetical protein
MNARHRILTQALKGISDYPLQEENGSVKIISRDSASCARSTHS